MRVKGCRQILCHLAIHAAAFFLCGASVFGQQATEKNCREEPKDSNRIRLATGPQGGSYLRIGQELHRSVKNLDVCLSGGSLENLTMLSENEADFAIVQGDLVHAGWANDPPPDYAREGWSEVQFDRLRLVRWLFSERLQIMTGPHSYISSLGDLRKKRIWLGLPMSGSRATSIEVLRAAGLDLSEIIPPCKTDKKACYDYGIKSYEAASQALVEGKVDAVFRVTSVPLHSNNEAFHKTLATPTDLFRKHPEVHLIGLDRGVIARVLQNPSYVEAPIYRNSYPNQKNGVLTIGIEAVLITRLGNAAADGVKVNLLHDALMDNRIELQKQTNIELDLLDKQLDPALESDLDLDLLNSVVHPSVRDQLTNKGKWRSRGIFAGFMLVAAFGLAFLFNNKRTLEALGNRSKYIVTVGILVSVCGTFGFVLWYLEERFSFDFQSPVSAAESLFVYFARGLRTEALMTEKGQIIALFALAVIATLVHWIHSQMLNDTVDGWSKRLGRLFYGRASSLRPNSRRRIVLNWNNGAAKMVREWTNGKPTTHGPVFVVAPERPIFPPGIDADHIEFLFGDPKSIEALEQARVADAESILICSTWRRDDLRDRRKTVDSELADNYTIRTIQAIRSLCAPSATGRSILIQAEICIEKNRREAKIAGSPRIEILPPEFFFSADPSSWGAHLEHRDTVVAAS
jgi:uncharacterized protein